MNVFHPWQFFLVALAGWINRHQQDVITYIQEENRILCVGPPILALLVIARNALQ